MKFSESWLRTMVDPRASTDELAHALTFGGLEVEELERVAPAFERVVVGEVLQIDLHPQADRLRVCRVNVGVAPLAIVCGAPDVRVGMKVATALAGAQLPGLTVEVASVRGVESHGMLCSARELGLVEEAAGLLELPAESEIGASVREALDLDDTVFVTKPTPNRGDCLSILGIAREASAITGAPLRAIEVAPVAPAIDESVSVEVEAPSACPLYCGRLVRGVDPRAPTPQWMKTRLARSGVRPISALVDITNYVMLELGQPLHAFDAARLEGGIRVRHATADETLELLNGETPRLDPGVLVIADQRRAVALAGIMGGNATAVTESTTDVFLESAFFAPEAVAGRSRALGIASESSFRFERGVDFGGTLRALERATELVLAICGGRAGPVTEARAALPARHALSLRLSRATRLLGIELERSDAEQIFRRLAFPFEAQGDVYSITPPTYRFDIAREEDLIEELARIHGYDRIPATLPTARVNMLPLPERARSRAVIRRALTSRDYHEVVTYSFVDARWEADFCANSAPVALANPIASHMSVMRSSLIGGLVACVASNLRHKQPRVRVFEIGRCFLSNGGADYEQPLRVGAAACGDALPEQWGVRPRAVDFYDVKGDLEALAAPRRLTFEPAQHPALHPGKSACVLSEGRTVGWIGELHPRWQQTYEIGTPIVLFEIEFEAIAAAPLPVYQPLSRMPEVRRDLAAAFDESVQHEAVIEVLRSEMPAIVRDVRLFDVYRGEGLEKGKKSLAFRVLLQDTQKTLTDAEVESAVSRLREILERRWGARLR
jgi:phenylalanyl-tRNA synthetase beta chain